MQLSLSGFSAEFVHKLWLWEERLRTDFIMYDVNELSEQIEEYFVFLLTLCRLLKLVAPPVMFIALC